MSKIEKIRSLMAGHKAMCDLAEEHDSRAHIAVSRDLTDAVMGALPEIFTVIEKAQGVDANAHDIVEMSWACVAALQELNIALAKLSDKGD